MRQQKFANFKATKPFGGTLFKKALGRTNRPLSTKKSMHFVLRSSKAIGELSFKTKRNRLIIDSALKNFGQKFGVKIYRMANSGNHLHLIVKLGNRYTYAAFIRALTGTLALKIAKRGKFWDYRPYSRVIEWGRAFRVALDYLLLNELEGLGVFPYSKNRLRGVELHPFSDG